MVACKIMVEDPSRINRNYLSKLVFLNLRLRICLLILEREEGRVSELVNDRMCVHV